MKQSFVHQMFRNISLKELAYKYSEQIWKAWKENKAAQLNDTKHPFQGSPQDVLKRGMTQLEGIDGNLIEIHPLSRVRFGDLSMRAKEQLDIAHLSVKDREDVMHPEFVDTFEENVRLSQTHLINNMVAATAVLDAILMWLVNAQTTKESLIKQLHGILNHDMPADTLVLAIAIRTSWLTRVCVEGTWENNPDFEFHYKLAKGVQELDPYVAIPVIKMLLDDLKSNAFDTN